MHNVTARVLKRDVVRLVKWRVRCGSLHCAYARLFLFRHPLMARILALAANCTPRVYNREKRPSKGPSSFLSILEIEGSRRRIFKIPCAELAMRNANCSIIGHYCIFSRTEIVKDHKFHEWNLLFATNIAFYYLFGTAKSQFSIL